MSDGLANYDEELVTHFLDPSRIGESIPGQYAHELARVAAAEHERVAAFRRLAVEAILAKPMPRGMSKMGETAFEQGKLEAIDILNTTFRSAAPVEGRADSKEPPSREPNWCDECNGDGYVWTMDTNLSHELAEIRTSCVKCSGTGLAAPPSEGDEQ